MPAAAITPAWRMPPPRRCRCARAASIRSARPAQQRADRRAEPLRQAEHDGVGRGDELGRRRRRARPPRSRCARRRQCTASAVRVRDAGDRVDLRRPAHGRPRRGHVRVLERQERDRRQVVRGAGERARDCVRRDRAVVVGQRAQLHAACSSARAAASYRYTCARSPAQHLGAGRARALGSRAGSPSCPTARRARPPCRAAPAASDSSRLTVGSSP